MNRILAIIFILFANTAFAFNDHYDCLQVGSSLLGWHSLDQKYVAASTTKSENPITVKLTDLKSKTPYLSGQSTVKLTKITSSPETVWFLEITPGGTLVTWTLFYKDKFHDKANTRLISSKNYNSIGPYNFTTMYECKS
jgi:hypothetical protein